MKEGYLYDQGPISYPIQEYKPDPGLKKRPSFVVDSTFPRLVQFYHPSSPICQSFQSTFIDTGRIFRSDHGDGYNQQHQRQRHDSGTTEAATVTFHAVNCAAHMDICSSPEFAIVAVPVLLAFSKGSQKGRVVKRTDDNRLVLGVVSNSLGVKLHGNHGSIASMGENRHQYPFQNKGDEHSSTQNENKPLINGVRGGKGYVEKTGSGNIENNNNQINGNTEGDDAESYIGMAELSEEEIAKEMMRRDSTNKMKTVVFAAHAGNHDQIVMKQDRNSLTQIQMYEDAATSFLITLEQNIYSPLDVDSTQEHQILQGNGSQRALPPLSTKRSDILKDFLDLCHWALPSSWALHGHINELRNNFSIITKHRRSLHDLIDRLDRPSSLSSTTWEWSDNCKRKSSGATDSNFGDKEGFVIDAELNYPYQCGLWKFFHILSVGIVEQRNHVMGDHSRVNPSYAAWVVRDFVDVFLIDEEETKIVNAHKVSSADENNEASNISRDSEIFSTQNRPQVWCKGCRDIILTSYDRCLYGMCSKEFNAVKLEKKRRSHRYLHKSDGKEWRKVAEWLWRAHNDVHYLKDLNTESGKNVRDPLPLSWPSKFECKECHRKGNLLLSKVEQVQGRSKSLSIHWDSDAIYDYLKSIYWPAGLQNPRVIIMKQETFGGRRIQSVQAMSSSEYDIWIILVVLLILWNLVKYRKICRYLISCGKKRIGHSPPPFNPYNDCYSFSGQAHTKQRVGKKKNGLFMHHTFLD